jgi:hypothetical protein
MADFTTASLVQASIPTAYANDITTSAALQVFFTRDLDSSTLSDATIALQVAGQLVRVPCTYSYAARVLTIAPSGGLLPATSYQLTLLGDTDPTDDTLTANITGIRDILGNGFTGTWTLIFKTTAITQPGVPVPVTPVRSTALLTQPTFSWVPVAAAASGYVTYYQVQVSPSNTFETLSWPVTSMDQSANFLTASAFTIPDLSFPLQAEYWWHVRAVVAPASAAYPPVGNLQSIGDWSPAWNFFYGDPTIGSVSPDDVPLGFPAPVAPITVIDANPLPGTSNLAAYPSQITVTLSGVVGVTGLTTANFALSGEPVDGNFDPFSFQPVFTPSLNGSMFGGGIDYPAPVDTYQQITPAGTATALGVSGLVNSNGTTTLTLTVSGGAAWFQDNNIYTVVLTLPELPAPIEWQFSSHWTPCFSSVRSVRNLTDLMMPELLDDDILYKIRHNSLYAIMIQVYVPTQIDGESWIYAPPMSFNVANPVFFVRKYVELKTAHDILRAKYWSLLTKPRVQLADFSVDHATGALPGAIKGAMDELEIEIMPYLDKLHGHTNRGYARGQWAQRGTGVRGSGASLGLGDERRDNSYLWPRTSRRQW